MRTAREKTRVNLHSDTQHNTERATATHRLSTGRRGDIWRPKSELAANFGEQPITRFLVSVSVGGIFEAFLDDDSYFRLIIWGQ